MGSVYSREYDSRAREERACSPDALAAILEQQREAFLRDGPPSLEKRRADLAKLRLAIKDSADRIADVISADFGNRSRNESLLAEVYATRAAIRYFLRHLAQWMRPKRVPVSLELQRGRARILFQPVGIVGIITPWNYPFQLAILPLATALAAGNRVILKPSELAPVLRNSLPISLLGSFRRSRWRPFSVTRPWAQHCQLCPWTICSTPGRRLSAGSS